MVKNVEVARDNFVLQLGALRDAYFFAVVRDDNDGSLGVKGIKKL